MSMDDLFKSFSMFQDGMQKLAVNSGIQNATAKVDEINSSMMDEMQKRQAKTQLAQQMAMQLTQAGANGQQIQTVMGSIAPPPLTSSRDAFAQAVATGDEKMMGLADKWQKFEEDPTDKKIAAQNKGSLAVAQEHSRGQLAAANARSDKRLNDTELSVVREQAKLYEQHTKTERTALNDAGSAIALLKSDNPLAHAQSIVKAIRASGDASVINDVDRKYYGGTKSFLGRIEQAATEMLSGKLSDTNRKFMIEVAELHKKRAGELLENEAKRFATRASKLTGTSYESAFEKIFAEGGSSLGQQAAQPAGPVEQVLVKRHPETGAMMRFRVINGDLKNAQPIK